MTPALPLVTRGGFSEDVCWRIKALPATAVLGAHAAAVFADCGVDAIYTAVRNGLLRSIRPRGKRRGWIIVVAWILDWIERGMPDTHKADVLSDDVVDGDARALIESATREADGRFAARERVVSGVVVSADPITDAVVVDR